MHVHVACGMWEASVCIALSTLGACIATNAHTGESHNNACLHLSHNDAAQSCASPDMRSVVRDGIQDERASLDAPSV